jgi:hypothetical protein
VYDTFSSYSIRRTAFREITAERGGDSLDMLVALKAMNDKLWMLRRAGLIALQDGGRREIEKHAVRIKEMAFSDPKAAVRREALACLRKIKDPSRFGMFLKAYKDSSYQVSALALDILFDMSIDTAVMLAETNLDTRSYYLRSTSAEILSKKGKGDYQQFFEDAYEAGDWGSFYYYPNYVMRLDSKRLEQAFAFLERSYETQKKKKDGHKSLLDLVTGQIDEQLKKAVEQNREKASKLKKTDASRLIYEEEARKADELRKRISRMMLPG